MFSTSTPPITISAVIGGRRRSRAEVLAWEDKRITVAARKLDVTLPASGDVTTRREALLAAKLEMGSTAIAARFARDVALTDFAARVGATLSTGRSLVPSQLEVAGGSARDFVDWFFEGVRTSDDAAMLRACPDHYVLRTDSDGRQEVVQATGSSPLATRFFLSYGKSSTLVTPRDPAYEYEISAIAQMADGTLAGGARLQFGDTERGFRARLVEELPRLSPPHMVRQQGWHCVCEFSNWIEAAFK